MPKEEKKPAGGGGYEDRYERFINTSSNKAKRSRAEK
jgi:hypothetical protein